MLQKLENAYLAILRFVVILAAGLMLVTTAILGLNSFKAFQNEPAELKVAPHVTAEALTKRLTANSGAKAEKDPEHSQHADSAAADPNAKAYERAAKLVVDFLGKDAEPSGIDKEEVISLLQDRAAIFSEGDLASAYITGFAESLEKTLADPAVIKLAKETSALDVIGEVMDAYGDQFQEQVDKAKEGHEEKLSAYHTEKAEGMLNLYMAGAMFAVFLSIVFLSLIIRIERNLRHLETKSSTQG